MIEKTDRTLRPGEYDDLIYAYLKGAVKDKVVCRESISNGKLVILVEIPLGTALPYHIVLHPREAISRLANSNSGTSIPEEE